MPFNLSDAYIGCLTTRHIVLQDDDGKEVGTIQGTRQGPALWLTAPDGSKICVIALTDMTAFGIYDKENDPNLGPDLALGMSNGAAVVQFRTDGGEVQNLKLSDIKEHITKSHVHETHTG